MLAYKKTGYGTSVDGICGISTYTEDYRAKKMLFDLAENPRRGLSRIDNGFIENLIDVSVQRRFTVRETAKIRLMHEFKPISTHPKSTQANEKGSPVDERTEIRADVGVDGEKVEHRASSCEIDNGVKDTLVTADKVEKIEQFRDLMTK
jgi:hypothetical protein